MNLIIRTAVALSLLLLLPSLASAELRRVQLNVLGMDWAFCAHAVSVAIKKLDGVESVDVSLEKATADIQLKVGNKITLPQLRRIIRQAGYPTKEARVEARGAVVERNGRPTLDLQNGSFLELAGKPSATVSGSVEVAGVSRVIEKDREVLTITNR